MFANKYERKRPSIVAVRVVKFIIWSGDRSERDQIFFLRNKSGLLQKLGLYGALPAIVDFDVARRQGPAAEVVVIYKANLIITNCNGVNSRHNQFVVTNFLANCPDMTSNIAHI